MTRAEELAPKLTRAELPKHLQKYIVEQDYSRYSPRDHAVWRFTLRQLKNFLSQYAHECYIEGLEKTGIEIDRIPRISDISAKIEKFGWQALPVSGFIPPAAFMELQSLSVLPIASDIRTLDHLEYTPAPDIIHEAAGHAPILVSPEFATYLKQYARVARKAIISKEDIELYRAIRDLSDLKEHPDSTPDEIARAEEHLNRVAKNISEVSEASILGRMNWWTAEYGLIGDLSNPKIFGAGLLSSLSESRGALSPNVRKLPLTLSCIDFSYDITEPQPQLFVTPSFSHLGKVLQELAETMAFHRGGSEGLQKAISAETINSLELDSGLQISGVFVEPLRNSTGEIFYYRATGRCQIAYHDQVLPGHNHDHHPQGFSAPLGCLKSFATKPPHLLTSEEWGQLGVNLRNLPAPTKLEFLSGVCVEGTLTQSLERDEKTLLLSFTDCTVRLGDQILFAPDWGVYDLALGTRILSVFGGAADREAFGESEDFAAVVVPTVAPTPQQKEVFAIYQRVRDLREAAQKGEFAAAGSPHAMPTLVLGERLEQLLVQTQDHPEDWLLLLELYEIAKVFHAPLHLQEKLQSLLQRFLASHPQSAALIESGCRIADLYMSPGADV